MKKVGLLLLFLLLAAAGGVAAIYLRTRQPYRGYGGAEQFVDIPGGSGTIAIGGRLVAAGVVRDPITFRFALWLSGHASDRGEQQEQKQKADLLHSVSR